MHPCNNDRFSSELSLISKVPFLPWVMKSGPLNSHFINQLFQGASFHDPDPSGNVATLMRRVVGCWTLPLG